MISLKMEIPEHAWKEDPSGIVLANYVNSNLPNNVKVFSVLPSQKYVCACEKVRVKIFAWLTYEPVIHGCCSCRRFDARRECTIRIYSYLLPAEIIGIKNDCSSAEVAEHLSEFGNILKGFEVCICCWAGFFAILYVCFVYFCYYTSLLFFKPLVYILDSQF